MLTFINILSIPVTVSSFFFSIGKKPSMKVLTFHLSLKHEQLTKLISFVSVRIHIKYRSTHDFSSTKKNNKQNSLLPMFSFSLIHICLLCFFFLSYTSNVNVIICKTVCFEFNLVRFRKSFCAIIFFSPLTTPCDYFFSVQFSFEFISIK